MSSSYKFRKFKESEDDDGIVPHKHCPVCGRQIYDIEQEYCSDACKQLETSKDKNKKKSMWKKIGIYGGITVVVIVVMVLLSGL